VIQAVCGQTAWADDAPNLLTDDSTRIQSFILSFTLYLETFIPRLEPYKYLPILDFRPPLTQGQDVRTHKLSCRVHTGRFVADKWGKIWRTKKEGMEEIKDKMWAEWQSTTIYHPNLSLAHDSSSSRMASWAELIPNSFCILRHSLSHAYGRK